MQGGIKLRMTEIYGSKRPAISGLDLSPADSLSGIISRQQKLNLVLPA
jgi:hypothetical protein